MSAESPCPSCDKNHHPDQKCCSEKKTGRITLTQETLYGHLQAQGNVAFVEASELLKDRSEACVDGRGELGIIGVPGGNAGEFVLALSVYEDLTKQKFSEEQITKNFAKYLDEYGKFYLHTDTHALKNMGITEADLEAPTDEKQQALLEKLTNPDNIGCGHLKLAMKNSEKYEMRLELIQGMLRAFFKALWSKNPNVEFVVLAGEHKEGAVISIKVTDEKIIGSTKIPTIKPAVGDYGTQTFVYHPQAVSFLRDEIAKGINKVTGAETSAEVDVEEFAKAMKKKGDKQLEHTVGALAKDGQGNKLPFFEVVYDSEGKISDLQEV